MYLRVLFIVLFASYFFGQVHAQEPLPTPDSVKVAHDSLRAVRDSVRDINDSIRYGAIESFAKKKKFTKFLYRLLLKEARVDKTQKTKTSKSIKPKPYLKDEGKIVRDIHVVTFDPFGHYVQDTSLHPQGWLMKTGNALHAKTRETTIKNMLLFKKGELFDSLVVQESERLIRSQKYLRDVEFFTKPASKGSDSLDVYVWAWDVWSLIPGASFSGNSTSLDLTDDNFIGLGHRFRADTKWERPAGTNFTRFSYLIPNIKTSYISARAEYYFSGKENLLRTIAFERNFYSPLTKLAGGIFLGQMKTSISWVQQDSILHLSSRNNVQDYWAARSWQLFKGNSVKERTTNLILSGRLLVDRYPGRPQEAVAANVFNNQTVFFAGLGVTSRQYTRDRYIFDYGKVEDVPVGRAFGITAGVDVKQRDRWYLGLQAAWGNYYRFGYLSTHFEYGTFIKASHFRQGVITGRLNYFTPLYQLGNWKIRQFVKPTVIVGLRRLPGDNLTFNEHMKGFEELAFPATSMVVLTLQTQSYAPWNLIGFRFGPYVFASLGMLGNESSGFSRSRLYSFFGLGVLIKNDYLIFSNFQISLAFYPFVPGKGAGIFKTNSFITTDYGFRGFEISKPSVVDFN
ncbi:MAG: hypothetical protein PHH42_00160 [Bacteroidales bacterium]|nr:hypothetical protein [Bacteroidales bacterium]